MSLLKKLVLVAAPISLALFSMPNVASAQGSLNPQAGNGFTGSSCPSGWSSRGATRMCYPGSNARPAYPMTDGRTQCAPGYGASNYWCLEGQQSLAEQSSSILAKSNPLDRCPVGFFTDQNNGRQCITELSAPPTVRAKGAGPCRTGEVEDWGIWCVSNFSSLRRDQANYGARDSNAIFMTSYYTTGSQQGTRQANLPEGVEYSPAYITIFGRVSPSGQPLGTARPAATSAAPAAPTGPSGTGSLNPQRRNQVASLCPEGWFGGLAGTARPDPNMCYPGPGALPAYPPQREGEPCAPGHVVSSTWCVNVSGATGAQAAAQPAQTAPNCPPASTGTAAQAGAALGGLLGARRGNGQAGAAIGGLLGQAAGGATPPRLLGLPSR
jgi:hypothetical protein